MWVIVAPLMFLGAGVQTNGAAQLPPPSTAPAAGGLPSDAQILGPNGEPLTPEQEAATRKLIESDPDFQKQIQALIARHKNAHDTDAPEQNRFDPGAITVTGRRPRGSVIGDIPARRTYDHEDIRALGATSIGDLVKALKSDLDLGQGPGDEQPVVLLNGRRIASFNEIADIPTEAVLRTEVFPPELAVKYGYRSNQNVLNIVLLQHFVSRIAAVGVTAPTQGGYRTTSALLNLFRVKDDARINADLSAVHNSDLFDSQRGIIEPSAAYGPPDDRSLLPRSTELVGDGTIATRFTDAFALTVNGHFDSNANVTQVGLVGAQLIEQRVVADKWHLGATLAGGGGWQWTVAGTLDNSIQHTTLAVAGAVSAEHAVDTLGSINALLAGSPLTTPAGPVNLAIEAGGDYHRYQASAIGSIAVTAAPLKRGRYDATASLDVPLANAKRHFLPWAGYVSVNANASIEHLSDVGQLRTYGYGISWTPASWINVTADNTHRQTAPTLDQIGASLVSTPNVPYFDYATGITEALTFSSSGTPGLKNQQDGIFRLGVAIKPWPARDINLFADYTGVETKNPLVQLPIGLSDVQQAFPQRFIRDASGMLTEVAGGTVNLDRLTIRRLRGGVNFTQTLSGASTQQTSARAIHAGSIEDVKRIMGPNAIVSVAPRGSAAEAKLNDLMSRMTFDFYWTHRFVDRFLLTPSAGPLDLLHGGALNSTGGVPRDELDAKAGVYKRGLGMSIEASWAAGSNVRNFGQVLASLHYRPNFTFNLLTFVNLGDRFGFQRPPLRSTRLEFEVLNAFGRQPDVTNKAGITPLLFQRGYLNPIGRTIRLGIRAHF